MGDLPKLSSGQQEILDAIIGEGLSPQQIAFKRGKSHQSIYKIVKILRRKGYLERLQTKRLQKHICTSTDSSKNIKEFFRLHGLEFHVVPFLGLKADGFYQKVRERSNVLVVSGCTVRLFAEVVEVYSGENVDFRGNSVNRVTRDAQVFFNRVFRKLEAQLHIGIVKDRLQNIKVVNSHYSHVSDGLAKDVGSKKLVVVGLDGKVWFKVDNSLNLWEAETVHPVDAKIDAQLVFERHLNDWKENNPPTNSELLAYLTRVAGNQDVYNENIRKHLGVLDKMDKSLSRISLLLGKKPIRDKLVKVSGGQRRLDSFG
jgi:transposase